MEKTIILTSQCQQFIDLVIRVDNWDDKCAETLNKASRNWHESTMEFRNVVESSLTEAGDKFQVIDDYIIIDDPAG